MPTPPTTALVAAFRPLLFPHPSSPTSEFFGFSSDSPSIDVIHVTAAAKRRGVKLGDYRKNAKTSSAASR
jgi:hypothetical protein